MPISRVWAAALASLLSSGCLSGQTGSPECVGPTSCVCDTLYGGGALLRVHGESAEEGVLVAVVDEVLGSVYGLPDVRAGDRVAGALTTEKPCDPEDRSTSLGSGESLVLFIPGTNGDYPRCDSETPAVCAEQRAAALMSGEFRFVLLWEEQLNFGADHRLPAAEVAALFSVESCWQRFPLGPTAPCNDVVAAECGLRRPPPASTGFWGAAALVGLTVVRAARRRRRRPASVRAAGARR